MKWVGYWMIVVAILHCGLSMALYGGVYAELLGQGLIGSVETEAHRLAVWFLVGGVTLFLLGLCFLQMPVIPASVGAVMLVLAVVGGALQPASGFWFLIPPAVAILWNARQSSGTV